MSHTLQIVNEFDGEDIVDRVERKAVRTKLIFEAKARGTSVGD